MQWVARWQLSGMPADSGVCAGKLAPGEKKLASSLDKQLTNEFSIAMEPAEVRFLTYAHVPLSDAHAHSPLLPGATSVETQIVSHWTWAPSPAHKPTPNLQCGPKRVGALSVP